MESARCSVCGETLDVYEPVVALDSPPRDRRTSLALEPWLENQGTIVRHVGCAQISEVRVEPIG